MNIIKERCLKRIQAINKITLLGILTIIFPLTSPMQSCLTISTAKADGPLNFGETYFSDKLTSDRPTFTESSYTIDAGHFQLESGYTYTYDSSSIGNDSSSTIPEALVRVGLTPTTEFRLAWLGYSKIQSESTDDIDGVTDFSFGFKHEMAKEGFITPRVSILGELVVPVGSSELTSDDVGTVFKILLERGLKNNLTAASNLNFITTGDSSNGNRVLTIAGSTSLGIGLTEDISSYIEYFLTYPDNSTGTEHYAFAGLKFLTHENLQLDIRAGHGLNGRADDLTTGVGFAFRR